MNFLLSRLPDKVPDIAYGVVGITAAVVVASRLSWGPNLAAFPTVGPSSLLGPWWAGFKYLADAEKIIQEGYEKHKSAPFKVAEKFGWVVVVSDRKQIEELVRVPEDELSFMVATNERLNSDYTVGREIQENPTHIPVIRSQLTRNIGTMYPEIRDELVTAFDEVLELSGNEWKSVPALSMIQQVVCRTTNRLLVGLPLCRNPDWIDLNIWYTIDLITAARVIGLFPTIFKPLVACFFTRLARGANRGLKLLGPIIKERMEHIEQFGDKAEKPNDFLSWLMDEDPQLTVKPLVTRMLSVNFAAIHTSSSSFTHVLFYLAAHPQYLQPLREEVESIVEKEGWSKSSLAKMRKVDSFLREVQRIEGLFCMSLIRKAMKDFTFSDGTFIPKGTLVGVPVRALHYDNRLYEHPDVFEPFRFADTREGDGEGAKRRFVSTAADYLAFGHGIHACPGRFFAANELKSMLAHIVTTYDVKLEDNTSLPRSGRFGTSIIPDSRAKVLFRKRVD